MSGSDFATPFRAFFVYSAERVATIAAWRRAFPQDAAARAAEAAHHHQVSILIADRRFDGGWSPARRTRWEAAVERAAAGYAAALEANPAQLFAARQMHWLNRDIAGDDRWQAATTTLETHAPPAFAVEWQLFTLARQQRPDAVQDLCEGVDGRAPGLTRETCYAVALINFHQGRRREVLEMLEAADTVAFPHHQLFAMRIARRPLEERVAFSRAEESPFHTNALLALDASHVPGAAIQSRDVMAEAVELDPTNPLLAPKYAGMISMVDPRGPSRGRTARMLTQDRSAGPRLVHRLLATHDHAVAPFNAAMWLAIDLVLPRHSGEALPFVERAIAESGNDPDAWLFAGRDLIDPKEWIGIGPDYRPLRSFECRKRNILRLVADACPWARGSHQICAPQGLEQVAAQLNDIATLSLLDCSAAPDLGVEMQPDTVEEEG
ncbi:MAG: hypothetical protein AAF899_06205 [Pseudomonadota bacterium]